MMMNYKLIAGPMATLSHPAFRILLEKFGGCDEYFTEMINAGSLCTRGPFEKFYIDPQPCPQKIVWQLTGFDSSKLEQATGILCELPGLGIDLNMGCSAPDVYKVGAGISWMIKPIEETKEMVRRVYSVIKNHNDGAGEKLRFSVKLRLGDDDFTDENFFAFTDMLVSEGVELLTLHPRTKKEKLIRPPRYEYCERLCERYKNQGIKIYLNGNVKDEPSLKNAVTRCPDVSGVMIARACAQKPWIFSELKGNHGHVDMKEIAFDFISDVEKYQPREFWKTRLQRFFAYYSLNFKFSHYAQTQFLNAKDNEDLKIRLEDFFQKCPEEQFINY